MTISTVLEKGSSGGGCGCRAKRRKVQACQQTMARSCSATVRRGSRYFQRSPCRHAPIPSVLPPGAMQPHATPALPPLPKPARPVARQAGRNQPPEHEPASERRPDGRRQTPRFRGRPACSSAGRRAAMRLPPPLPATHAPAKVSRRQPTSRAPAVARAIAPAGCRPPAASSIATRKPSVPLPTSPGTPVRAAGSMAGTGRAARAPRRPSLPVPEASRRRRLRGLHRLASRHAIDAIHEVPGIDQADRREEGTTATIGPAPCSHQPAASSAATT